MDNVIETRSRLVVYSSPGNQVNYPFSFGVVNDDDISVYVNGLALEAPAQYRVENSSKVVLTPAAEPGSTIEIVRVTPPSDPITPTEIRYTIDEAFDEFVFQDGHGRGLIPSDPLYPSSLFTNSLDTANPMQPYVYPVIQLLPDGRLVPDPDGINAGGFVQAALRFQNRILAIVLPVSMTAGGFFSVVIEKPNATTATSNKSYYGFRFLCKGYQTALGDFLLENAAINPVAETAAGVTRGTAQSIISEARHEAAQAVLVIEDEAKTYKLIFTAQGIEEARGEAGNRIYIEILAAAGDGSVAVTADEPPSDDITISITPALGEATAEAIAEQVRDNKQASALVSVTASGTGQVASEIADNLKDGEDTDGKLVGNQTLLTPRGKDPGPGYANEFGAIVISEDLVTMRKAFTSFGHTINCDGFYPGLGAVIAKGKADPGEPVSQGWYNAYIADDRTKARFIWMPRYCAIEVPGFTLDEGPNPRSHCGMWMGLGTDEPRSHLHIKTIPVPVTNPPSIEVPETPEITLEKIARSTGPADISGITMLGHGNYPDPPEGEPPPETKIMASIVTRITGVLDGDEDAEIVIGIRRNGAFGGRWRIADGIRAEGLMDKGPGSINAANYHIGGTTVLYADAATPGAVKMRLGNPQARPIGGGEIDYVASSMIIDTEGGEASDNLDTINGGTVGDILILRTANNNRDVIVMNGTGNINCGAPRTLSKTLSTITLVRTANEGWVCTGYQAN